MLSIKNGLSRRSLLKAAGLSSALSMLGIPLVPAKAAEEAKGVHLNAKMKDGWHYGHCRMCMRGTCPNLYRVENGIAVEVMGNPNCPTTKGALCAKGQTILQNTYNAYRVKAPMKRTNPKKGLDVDPQWVEISWDEALSTVADKLGDIRRRDPRRFLYQVGFGDMDFFCTFMFYFAQCFGTPNFVKSNGILCTLHYASDLVQGVFPGSVPDATYCRYFIAMGLNVGMGIGSCEGGTRGIFDLMYEGNKDFQLVVVDPRCSPEASKGEWVPIKPGGDLAFLMGMINVIFYEIGKLDDHFLKWRTNAPYLIGPDGYYLRNKNGKPLIRDAADGKVKAFNDKTLKDPDLWASNIKVNGVKTSAAMTFVKAGFKDTTPEWAEKICDIPAERIRHIANEFIHHARIGETVKLQNSKGEWVEMPVRGSMIEGKRGIKNQRDGAQCDLLCKMMAMLIGGIDVPGGTVAKSRGAFHLKPDADGVVEPKGEARDNPMSYPPKHINLSDYFPHKHTLPVLAYKVAQDPKKYGFDYEIEASLTVGSNPIASTTEPYEVLKGVMNIPFVVNIAYHYDEMAQMSDILLASHSVLERESVNCFEGAFDLSTAETNNQRLMMYRDPLQPIYNTRQPQDIIIELCERMGMIDDFNANLNKVGVVLGEVTTVKLPPEEELKPGKRYTISEIWDKGAKAAFNGRGLDYLKKEGLIIQERAPAEAYNAYWYKDGESRHPIYFDRIKSSGERQMAFFKKYKDQIYLPDFVPEDNLKYFEPVITWRSKEILELKPTDEYPLVATNFKTPTSPSRCSGDDQLPWIVEASETFDPQFGKVCVNPITAKEYGLKEGDIIWVESKNGKTSGPLHLSELFRPGTVNIAGSLGRLVKSLGLKAYNRPMYNLLCNGKPSESCPYQMGVQNNVPVKIYKAKTGKSIEGVCVCD